MMRLGRALARLPKNGSSKSNHDGFVLVAALLAIVLIGALVAGALFAATEDTRAGATGVARDLAVSAAESAIGITIRDRAADLPTMIGTAGTTSSRIDGPGTPAIVYITRLDSTTYWILADVVADPARWGARRRIGVVVTLVKAPDGSISIDPISERWWAELF
jgi:type II secretory pathway pseudopilin PulG